MGVFHGRMGLNIVDFTFIKGTFVKCKINLKIAGLARGTLTISLNPYQMMQRSYGVYFRVSTQKPGRSGLGLEAQRSAVDAYVGNPALLVGEYTDIESGKKADRPQLLAAIAYS